MAPKAGTHDIAANRSKSAAKSHPLEILSGIDLEVQQMASWPAVIDYPTVDCYSFSDLDLG